jgi:hypothetical protein
MKFAHDELGEKDEAVSLSGQYRGKPGGSTEYGLGIDHPLTS